MFAHASRLPFSLDPLIAEARRRMRRRRVIVIAVIVAIAGGGGGAAAALHGGNGARPTRSRPSSASVANVFGRPSGSAEGSGPPLRAALGVLRSHRLAAALPASNGSLKPLSWVASRTRGDPGALVAAQTRRVTTPVGPVYLVPTTRGWLCVQGPTFQTCHRGLLRQGVTWSFYSTQTGVDVVGIAADDVSAVTLAYGKSRRVATLRDNVFFVRRPLSFTSSRRLPPIGTLTISYRGDRPRTSVPVD